jgi:hypothetical protein
MPIIGPNLGVGGAGNVPPEKPRGVRGARVKSQDVVTEADTVELDKAVRSVKSNDQEESHEDHEQGGAYTKKGMRSPGDDQPRLDVAG